MNKPGENNANQLLTVGFLSLMTGIVIARLADSNRSLQVVGLVLVVISSVLFGASIAKQNKDRNL